MFEISNRLRDLRQSKKYSVYRLAKESEISENYIHKVEHGESQPSIYVLERLLSCLGLTLPEFLCDDSGPIYPTAYERELLESVRALSEEQAAALLQLIKLMKK